MKFFKNDTCADMGEMIGTVEADRGSVILQLFDTPSGDYEFIISYVDREEYFLVTESHDMYSIVNSIYYAYKKTDRKYENAYGKDDVMREITEGRLSTMDNMLKQLVYLLHDEEYINEKED